MHLLVAAPGPSPHSQTFPSLLSNSPLIGIRSATLFSPLLSHCWSGFTVKSVTKWGSNFYTTLWQEIIINITVLCLDYNYIWGGERNQHLNNRKIIFIQCTVTLWQHTIPVDTCSRSVEDQAIQTSYIGKKVAFRAHSILGSIGSWLL